MAIPPQGSFVRYIGLLKLSAVIIPSQRFPKQKPFSPENSRWRLSYPPPPAASHDPMEEEIKEHCKSSVVIAEVRNKTRKN